MTQHAQQGQAGLWTAGQLPANVRIGLNTVIHGEFAFKRFHSQLDPGLVIGPNCTMDGVQFGIGPAGQVSIGEYSYFTSVVLLAELEIIVGNFVVIGWNTTVADTDFHPISPADRIADALACSPLGKGKPRPEVPRKAVFIEDDVWIGPNATILKGVRIGRGSFIEPGALLTQSVPANSRVLGNPAQVIGNVTTLQNYQSKLRPTMKKSKETQNWRRFTLRLSVRSELCSLASTSTSRIWI